MCIGPELAKLSWAAMLIGEVAVAVPPLDLARVFAVRGRPVQIPREAGQVRDPQAKPNRFASPRRWATRGHASEREKLHAKPRTWA